MQKITPCLWFDDQAEKAAEFYTTIFKDGKILNTTKYLAETPSDKPIGSTLTVDFEIEGFHFTALNGGSFFKPNPSISFFIQRETKEEIDALHEKLSEGGKVLMPLDTYPFSERYSWVEDKFGVSWQLILPNPDGDWRPGIVPSLLFVGEQAGNAEAAIDFYASVFSNAERGQMVRYPAGMEPEQEGTIMFADFQVAGQWFAAMDSANPGHEFSFSEGISFVIVCKDQEEIDYFWEKLSAVPESEQCGWLKDKFGVSWQVVPEALGELLEGPDTERGKRVMEALLQMKKLDIEKLCEAYEQ